MHTSNVAPPQASRLKASRRSSFAMLAEFICGALSFGEHGSRYVTAMEWYYNIEMTYKMTYSIDEDSDESGPQQ